MDLKVTNSEQLKEMAKGEIIELPGFIEEVPFFARVKKLSLLNLVQKGVIPNSLLSAAEEVFYGKKSSKGNVDMAQMTKVMLIIVENTLLEPSVKQIQEAGLELTDMQCVDLFQYTQHGIKALSSFRKEQQDTEHNIDSDAIPGETQ